METKPKYNLEKMIATYKNIYYQNPNFNSKNFPVPETIATKGFKIIKMSKHFTSQEALDRIKSEGCRPANIYELLLWSKDNQEKKTYTLAFGSQWEDAGGDHRVPYVSAHSDGGFKFHLGNFERDWDDGHCLLCVCDQNLEPETLKNSDTLTLESLDNRLKKIEEFVNKFKSL